MQYLVAKLLKSLSVLLNLNSIISNKLKSKLKFLNKEYDHIMMIKLSKADQNAKQFESTLMVSFSLKQKKNICSQKNLRIIKNF